MAGNWTEFSFHTNGQDIFYRRYVRDDKKKLPTLVYIHGLSLGGALFIPLMQNLVDDFDIVLPDSRGSGKSAPIVPGTFTMPILVSDAISIIRHVSPNDKVFLVAHSLGASTAARVARAEPGLVRALVLEDPPWFRTPDQPVNVHERSVIGLLNHCRSLKLLPDEEFYSKYPRPHDLLPLAITKFEAQRAFDVDNVEPTFQDTDDLVNESVPGLQMPVLLMVGDNETGARCKEKIAQEMLSTWPNGTKVHFPGGDHFLHSNSVKWIDEVRKFLTKHA